MRARIAKTKTFEGCWTCRRRKVKCQGQRPVCERCTKSGLTCDYETRLCWVSDAEIEFREATSRFRQRIAIPRGNNVLDRYSEKEANLMLELLERNAQLLTSGSTTRHGPFSVFHTNPKSSSSRATRDHQASKRHTAIPHRSRDGRPKQTMALTLKASPLRLREVLEQPGPNDSISVLSYESPAEEAVEVIDQRSHMPTAISIPWQPSLLGSSLDSSKLRVNELFSHYLLRVADVTQVISHSGNIFRSIYAKFAMQVWTQPLFNIGPQATLSSHKAIFCALVSTAAFHLRGLSSLKHVNWELYNHVGISYRLRALQYLQQAITEPSVDTESHCAKLSAMLTLVELDVMEGSFAGFFAHLRGCHQARNLRMLQSPQPDSSQSRVRQLEITSMFMDTIANTTATDWTEPRHFPRYSDQPVLLDVPFEATDTFLEHSYGITTSIASMIYSTNKIWLYTQGLTDIGPLSTEEVNDSLAHLAERLETWAPSSEDYTSFLGDDAIHMPLMKSLSTAIYYATRIYFHSCFRSNSTHQNSMPTRLSDLTLMALEQSESVRGPSIKAGAPLSWPAFIAACEAPPALRRRWMHYWQTLLKHQIGTQQAAWEIVQEVWRRKELDEQGGLVTEYEAPVLATLNSCQVVEPAWISVIRDFGITIFAY